MINSFKFLLVLLPFSVCGQQTALQNELKSLVSDKDLKNASISFYAVDTENKFPIVFYDENRALVPASTMKLVTTASAYEMLGQENQFKTSIFYTGYVDSITKILYGDILVKGGGDPVLASHRFQKHYGDLFSIWASEIKKLGIDSINGRVIADASIFDNNIPSTWVWGDIGNYYGAGANGLSVYENFYTLSLKSEKEIGSKVVINSISPAIPNLVLKNELLSHSNTKDLAFIFGGPNQFNRLILGGIPVNRSDFSVKGSIPDPELLVAQLLFNKLVDFGVRFAFQPTTISLIDSVYTLDTLKEVTFTLSPKLNEIIKLTNLYSINLYAEHLLNHIGLKKTGIGATLNGAEAMLSYWKQKGVDVEGMTIYDGSGLSRFNSISAKQLVDILVAMHKSNNKDVFFNSLSVAGKSGTLSNIGKNTIAEGNVYAKSGYMNLVRSYAGYVITKSNKKIAFAIIVNNFNCSPSEMKSKLEKIMIQLAEID